MRTEDELFSQNFGNVAARRLIAIHIVEFDYFVDYFAIVLLRGTATRFSQRVAASTRQQTEPNRPFFEPTQKVGSVGLVGSVGQLGRLAGL